MKIILNKIYQIAKNEELFWNQNKHVKSDVFRQLPDDVEEQAEDGVEEDVRGCSIIFTRSKLVDLAVRTDLLNLKKPAQRPRHPWPLEQLLLSTSVVFDRFLK